MVLLNSNLDSFMKEIEKLVYLCFNNCYLLHLYELNIILISLVIRHITGITTTLLGGKNKLSYLSIH